MCAMVRSLPQCMYFTIVSSAVCMCGIGVLGSVCLFGGKGFSLPGFCSIKKFKECWLVLFSGKYWRALLLHSAVVLDKSAHANVQCCFDDIYILISFLEGNEHLEA